MMMTTMMRMGIWKHLTITKVKHDRLSGHIVP